VSPANSGIFESATFGTSSTGQPGVQSRRHDGTGIASGGGISYSAGASLLHGNLGIHGVQRLPSPPVPRARAHQTPAPSERRGTTSGGNLSTRVPTSGGTRGTSGGSLSTSGPTSGGSRSGVTSGNTSRGILTVPTGGGTRGTSGGSLSTSSGGMRVTGGGPRNSAGCGLSPQTESTGGETTEAIKTESLGETRGGSDRRASRSSGDEKQSEK
jgi:hypothetical protein